MGRPFIHINFALDSAAPSENTGASSVSVSCEADWQRVHTLREKYDAVAVGRRTWEIDSPRLTVRAERLGREPLRQPLRVVFARSDIRFRPDDLVVVCGTDQLLATALDQLWNRGIRSMLVEGGPSLIQSFLDQGISDEFTIFVRTDSTRVAASCAGRAFRGLPDHFGVIPCCEGFLLSFEGISGKPAGGL